MKPVIADDVIKNNSYRLILLSTKYSKLDLSELPDAQREFIFKQNQVRQFLYSTNIYPTKKISENNHQTLSYLHAFLILLRLVTITSALKRYYGKYCPVRSKKFLQLLSK